ncbi:MAG: alpha/beta hydrolase fold domain-containing protein [Planctomycetota bacterium]|jgi:acetyl esterase/lipase
MRRCPLVLLSVLACLLSIQLVILVGCAVGNHPSDRKAKDSTTICSKQKEVDEKYEVRVEKDLSYGPGSYEKFDLYTPAFVAPKQRFPGIIIIHGGGWVGGDKVLKREQNIGNTLAENGYVCISINYLLAEEGKTSWPTNIYNCKTAVQLLRKNAELFNVDADHIGVIGGSAGGHLSAMVGLTGPEAGLEPPRQYKGVSSRVQAVVALYGVHNLATFTKTDNLEKFLGAAKNENPALWALASPVNHISGDDPPFLIIHGTADPLVPVQQSVELHEKLQENGIDSQLVIVEGAPHSFHLQPKQQDLRPLVLAFLDKNLKAKPVVSMPLP